MIFILDFILAFNLWVAYTYYKNIVAPPVLMGSGMLAASLMATSYYQEWHMQNFLDSSVIILGGGTLFFTFCCIVFSKFFPEKRVVKPQRISMIIIREDRLVLFYCFAVIISLLFSVLTFRYYQTTFGLLDFSSLIVARRMDAWNNEFILKIPSYVRQMGTFTTIVTYLTIWIICHNRFSKVKIGGGLSFLLYSHLGFAILGAILSGSKAPVIDIFVKFVVIYMFYHYINSGSMVIKRKTLLKLFLILVVFALSFRGFSLLIGRNVANRTNSDLFAEYCGAEIKNFDVYNHSHSGLHRKTLWGENTFSSFYSEIYPNRLRQTGEFQAVGNYTLGNVYTQFKPFFQDFGYIGVFVMCGLIAFFSMYFYRRACNVFSRPNMINIYIFIYTSFSFTLFMSFFSSRFTEFVCTLGWLRTCLYFYLLTLFFKYALTISPNYLTKL